MSKFTFTIHLSSSGLAQPHEIEVSFDQKSLANTQHNINLGQYEVEKNDFLEKLTALLEDPETNAQAIEGIRAEFKRVFTAGFSDQRQGEPKNGTPKLIHEEVGESDGAFEIRGQFNFILLEAYDRGYDFAKTHPQVQLAILDRIKNQS